MKHRQGLRQIIALLLAAAVLGLAAIYGPELLQVLRRVDLNWAGAGALCYALNYIIRAQRFRVLSRSRVRVWPEGLQSACLHGFATYMMPFRSGELTLPVVLRSVSSLTLAEGGQLLVRARLLDFKILGMLSMAAAFVADIALPGYVRLGWFAIGLLLVAVPVLVAWLGVKGYAARLPLVRHLGSWTSWEFYTPVEIVLSFGIWTSVASVFFCVAQAIGLPLSITQVWLLITIQLPLQLLPIQGLANAGNHEGGWVAGLLLFGVPASAAIEFALASHAILLLYVIGLGLVGLILGSFVRACNSEP